MNSQRQFKERKDNFLRNFFTGRLALRLLCLTIFLFTIHYSLFTAFALEVPALKGYVNDYANMMSPEARLKIETELKAFEQSDSTQVVILTIPSLEGEALEQFSVKVAEAWKIGQKGKDNGAILLVSKQDRKIRIEVGRGLEGKLTDLMAGRIVNFVINPRFKRNDFDGGFIAATQALIDVTRGEFKVDETPDLDKKKTEFLTPSPFYIRRYGASHTRKDFPRPWRRSRGRWIFIDRIIYGSSTYCYCFNRCSWSWHGNISSRFSSAVLVEGAAGSFLVDSVVVVLVVAVIPAVLAVAVEISGAVAPQETGNDVSLKS